MRIKTFIIILSGLILSISAKEPRRMGIVTSENINVRTDSTIFSEIIGKLPQDKKIEIVEKKYEWYKIILPPEFKGYVYGDYVNFLNDKELTSRVKSLNIRFAPSLKSPIIGRLTPQDKVSLVKKEGKWYKINPYPFTYGWVHQKNIKILSLQEPEPKEKPRLTISRSIETKEKKEANSQETPQIKSQVKSGIKKKTEPKPQARGILKKYTRWFCPANFKLKSEEETILLKIDKEKTPYKQLINKKVEVWGELKKRNCPYLEVKRIRIVK